MSDTTESKVTYSTGRPIQILPWSEKVSKDKKWFEQNCDYFLSRSRFKGGYTSNSRRNLQQLYDIYNNKFPTSWFTHVTDPLSAKSEAHKKFPAKVRPVTILRTNLDLLISEYPRRPFVYQVNNLSDSGYNEFLESRAKVIEENLVDHFHKMLQLQLMDAGLMDDKGQPTSEDAAKQIQQELENMPLPEDVKETHFANYKDKRAIQGQSWIRRAIQEHEIRQKFNKNFKHWVIAGEVYSYKSVEFSNLVYDIVSPMDIDYLSTTDYVEDAEWVVRRRRLTLSDVVDNFYPELSKEDIETLDSKAFLQTPDAFQSYLSKTSKDDLIDVYHVVWKGKKEVLFVKNTLTGETYNVDEDYPIDRNMEEIVDRVYPNELYECTKVADLYLRKRAIPFQRNAMNNFSVCKGPYNGRRISDMESENVAPLEMGIPSQIMYIIVTRTLELCIAKSGKGKIFLIDQNAIPKTGGWDEEKFFYYAEALGYALVNRNQPGVDKSYNQYQVIDMTLFDSIKQLIELQQHYKQEWDDILGINRQRKGQTYASDAVGNNERATFQSTVITDMIFNNYEEFVNKELQGFLDLSRFTNIEGMRKLWNDTELGNQLLEIDPGYANAELGIFVESSAEALQTLKALQNDASAMIQNGVKPSTIVEIRRAQNVAELLVKLKKIEELQAQAEQAAAANEHEAQRLADERMKEFEQYRSTLETALMNAEYDRKEDLVVLEAQLQPEPEAQEPEDTTVDQEKLGIDREALNLERKKHSDTMHQQSLDRLERIQNAVEDRRLKREELAAKERIEAKKAAAAKAKAKATKSKSKPK